MDRRIRIVLLVLLAIALARYVVLSFFVHPFADDFSYAVAGQHNALVKRLVDEYRFWNGRWFSNILVLRGPLVLGLEKGLFLYRLVPIALMALTWFGAYQFIRALAARLKRSHATLGASLFLLLYLQLMPDLSEGIYWYTGAVSYQLPGALMLLLFAAWAKHVRAQASAGSPAEDPAGWGRTAWAAFLAAILCGCSELHMVFMVLFHAALLAVRWFITKRIDRSVVLVLLLSLVCAAIMILAPGNEGRGGQFVHKHEIGRTGLWGALQTGRFMLTWIASPALLIASLLALASRAWIMERAPVLSFIRPIPFILVLVVLVVPVFIAMALPYWSTGLLGQHRTVNATLLLFLPMWFLALCTIKTKRLSELRLNGSQRAMACVLLAIVVFATGSGGKVSADLLTGRLQAFDDLLDERYALIERARHDRLGELELPRLASRPHSLRYLDGTFDSGHWINRSIAQYFATDSMRIAIGPTPPLVKAALGPR